MSCKVEAMPLRYSGSFINNRRGALLVCVSALLPVLIGGGLLTIDFRHLSNLPASLQVGADGLKLAGAAELDRRSAVGGGLDSIDRDDDRGHR
jgi:Flp pilus assembly protein TadG